MIGEHMDGDRGAAARIEWCDIFKGILIVWVVSAHATFEFNRHLNQHGYQFVIAGFFFIAGYTAKAGRRSVFEEIINKFYKLMVPYYVIHFVGLWIFWALQQLGLLKAVSTTWYNVGYGEALLRLLEGNNFIYCDWLGAMWFIPVLFLAEIIFCILHRLCRKDGALFLASVLIFLCSEWLSLKFTASERYYYSIDLAGIAQAFMVQGYLLRRRGREREEQWWQLLVMLLLVGVVWECCLKAGFRNIFDWPARNVNGAVDLVLPFFGILMTITVSKLIAKGRILRRIFKYLGQYSMGIMCFHLAGFKVAYLILILLGWMDAGEAYRLIPSRAMAAGWPLIFGMGIAVSLLLWNGLNRFRTARFLLGGWSTAKVYAALMETELFRRLKAVYTFCVSLCRKTKALGWFVILACIMAAAVDCGTLLYDSIGRIEITFPYSGGAAFSEEGWLPQSDTEVYRWFERRAEINVFLVNQKELEIKGYIPESVEGASYLLLRVNGEEVYREPADVDQLIEIRLDISEYTRFCMENTIELETDGIRTPGETDEDQRSFSAFVELIALE